METTRTTDYRQLLRDKLEERCQRNARYSLRAYARDLGLSPSRLSEILSGRYGISAAAAREIAQRLGLSSDEAGDFTTLVESEHARSRAAREGAQKRLAERRAREAGDLAYQDLTLDAFKTISDWYHYAILELTYLSGFRADDAWIARQLGIARSLVAPAIERMKRLGLLRESEGKLIAGESFTATPSGIPSDALKKFHQQILERAVEALFTQSPAERDFSATIMAIDRARLPEIQAELRRIRRKFTVQEDQDSVQKNAVYCLSTQFFELTQKAES